MEPRHAGTPLLVGRVTARPVRHGNRHRAGSRTSALRMDLAEYVDVPVYTGRHRRRVLAVR